MKKQTDFFVFIDARWLVVFLLLSAACWAIVIYLIAKFLGNDGLIIAICVMAILFFFTGFFFALEIKKSQALEEVKEKPECQ